jgi:hypothetical protein
MFVAFLRHGPIGGLGRTRAATVGAASSCSVGLTWAVDAEGDGDGGVTEALLDLGLDFFARLLASPDGRVPFEASEQVFCTCELFAS